MTTPESKQSRAIFLLPIVVAIIGALTLASRSRPASPQPSLPPGDSPESCITRLLVAERAGAVNEFLDCFSPQLRTELRETWRAQGDRQAVAELRERSAGLVGHAISDLDLAPPDRASLILERIEKDHTARQRVELQRIDGRWLIAKLATADWQRPAIPYGTPVFTPQRDASP